MFALLLASCANQKPQDSLSPLGPVAREQDKLWDLTFLIAVVIFFIVELLLVYALVKFRDSPGRQAAQFHGNTKLEVILTVIPSLILAGIAVPTVQTIFDQAKTPDDALHVNVVGRQFWWEYEYVDSGVISADESSCARSPTLSICHSVFRTFVNPRLYGMRRIRGLCPPSNPTRTPPPVREFWPFWPPPDVLPWPEP